MYISQIHIKGYRNFKDVTISFNEGMNVIIGPNNCGKSNLLHAIGLVIDNNANRRLGIYDFCRIVSLEELKSHSPSIEITLVLSESKDEKPESQDLVMVRNCLTKLDHPYQAKITYRFFLSDKEDEYKTSLQDYVVDERHSEETVKKEIWQVIKRDFLRYYTYNLLCGEPVHGLPVDMETRQQFDFQYLDAIRNVEKDLFSGRDTLLRDVLDFFLDYRIKTDPNLVEEEKKVQLKGLADSFRKDSDRLINGLQGRLSEGKKKMLGYANKTGASSFHGAKPNFEGSLSETELFSALQLIIKYETGIEVAATHNGVGYNNLIYISLLLSKMQACTDGNYMGINAKIFPVLAIEEPEAHLHPSLQYKLLEFLKDEIREGSVRQLFVTTHSTHITSSIDLDSMICLYDDGNNVKTAYPATLFPANDEGEKSLNYVQRFLDVTKSNMLFADRILFVEGLAEEILVPTFAKLMDIDLDDKHIAVIAVDGRCFKHFLYMFDTKNNVHAIAKKIACITDMDPVRKDQNDKDASFESCYPYEVGKVGFDYKENGKALIDIYKDHPNIRYYSQDPDKGKTFEYDLMLSNPVPDILITDDLSNKKRISNMQQRTYAEALALLPNRPVYNRIEESLSQCDWEENDKKQALLASVYLQSVSKGTNALELSQRLLENKDSDNPKPFIVPKYIKDAIEWLIQ